MEKFDVLFAEFSQKMKDHGVPEVAIRSFHHYYMELAHGVTGIIRESEISPVENLPDAEQFGEQMARAGKAEIPRTVAIKLNGGLGTSMGLEKAKSLLRVKGKLSFLDIIAQQVLHEDIPLILMNSFATREDSLLTLRKYPGLFDRLPVDFLQHKVPKIRQRDLRPASSPDNPLLEWCPPGHGDLYTALVTSGILEQLLADEYRYCFVSNADNLGATFDEKILGYLVSTGSQFLMEVTDRTEADRKGGHLARLADGRNRLILREAAQCSQSDWDSFQDIHRHAYFNTNNLWIDLKALNDLLTESNQVIRLPMICNRKTLNPKDLQSTPVYQLETAMGAAISVFSKATAVKVSRSRFFPVKTCADLLAVRSDLTLLSSAYRIEPNPARSLGPFRVVLDPGYYGTLEALEERFPCGPPSLLDCESLEIKGDFIFGRDVVLRGRVRLSNETDHQMEIPDGSRIEETC